MKVEWMNHTGFVVNDLERSLEFYRDLLGLEVERDQILRLGLDLRCRSIFHPICPDFFGPRRSFLKSLGLQNYRRYPERACIVSCDQAPPVTRPLLS